MIQKQEKNKRNKTRMIELEINEKEQDLKNVDIEEINYKNQNDMQKLQQEKGVE